MTDPQARLVDWKIGKRDARKILMVCEWAAENIQALLDAHRKPFRQAGYIPGAPVRACMRRLRHIVALRQKAWAVLGARQ